MKNFNLSIEDSKAEVVIALLRSLPFDLNVIENKNELSKSEKPKTMKELGKVLAKMKGTNMFSDIEDPVEWQKRIRDEWA